MALRERIQGEEGMILQMFYLEKVEIGLLEEIWLYRAKDGVKFYEIPC